MYLSVEQFLKLDIIQEIIASLNEGKLVHVMEQALNVKISISPYRNGSSSRSSACPRSNKSIFSATISR